MMSTPHKIARGAPFLSEDLRIRHGQVRDLLRGDGIGEKVGGLDRAVTLASILGGDGN